MTINEMIEQEQSIAETRKSLEQDIKFWVTRAAEREYFAREAAGVGDYEKRDQLLAERQEAEATAREKQAELAAAIPHPEKLNKAWSDNSIGYTRTFRKKVEEYQAARESLGAQFLEIVKLQREMLEAREKIKKLMPDDMRDKVHMPETMPVPYFDELASYNGFRTTTDIAFFASCNAIPYNSIPGATEVIVRKEPVSEEYLRRGNNLFVTTPICPRSLASH